MNQIAKVFADSHCIASIAYSENPLHSKYLYLDLLQNEIPFDSATEIFTMLHRKIGKGFQVMIDSDATEVIALLTAAKFVCKRKCYEVDASISNYTGKICSSPITLAATDSPVYRRCCALMLERYIQTHQHVNPWTGTDQQFFDRLPHTVYVDGCGDQIHNFAFVDGNEIAYIYGTDRAKFSAFAEGLISRLFAEHHIICFEADDCDAYAMALRELFTDQPSQSFDTYIFSGVAHEHH